MTRRTNAELLEENRNLELDNLALKKALEDRDAELISFATYQRDFQNRWALHADEWHNLYSIDCPQYWANLIKFAGQAKQEVLSLIPTTK